MSDPAEKRIALHIQDSIATITLTREARKNSIDGPMHFALRDALSRSETDPAIRAVILTGSGTAFCAGQDLNERARTFEQGDTPDLRASLEDNYNPLIRRLARLDCPVISAVNGIAFGAGAGLAIAADIVLCAESARFQFGFVNVGLGPDSGVSWTLPRLVGQARALDLALTGRLVKADEAFAIGLVSRVVIDAELTTTARAIAKEFAACSSSALTSIKKLLRTNPNGSFDAALDAERDAQDRLGRSDAYRAAVLRFVQSRK